MQDFAYAARAQSVLQRQAEDFIWTNETQAQNSLVAQEGRLFYGAFKVERIRCNDDGNSLKKKHIVCNIHKYNYMYGYKENFFKLSEVEIVKTAFNDQNIIKLEKNGCKQNKYKRNLLEI